MRKIKLKLLGISGILYRVHVVVIQSIFFWLLTGKWEWAIGISIVWNIINTFLYYNYHYWFAKLFRIGKDMDKGKIIWFTGLSGSGKSALVKRLAKKMDNVIVLDGDTIRKIFPTTGFSQKERTAHIKRVGYTATLLAQNGLNVLCSLISPFEDSRNEIKRMYDDFILVYVKCPVEVCIQRDTKGLYKKAIAGEIKNFTGISQKYEEPQNPDIIVETNKLTKNESIYYLVKNLKKIL